MPPDPDSYMDDDLTDQDPREAEAKADEEASADQTALIPKSALMGKQAKVGDRLSFEVTGVFQDEYEVVCRYESEPDSDSDEDALEPAVPVGATDPLME